MEILRERVDGVWRHIVNDGAEGNSRRYSPLIPVDLKVLWIDVMEIVWVAILSATVNSAGDDDGDNCEGPRVPWGEGRWAEPVVDEGGAVSR